MQKKWKRKKMTYSQANVRKKNPQSTRNQINHTQFFIERWSNFFVAIEIKTCQPNPCRHGGKCLALRGKQYTCNCESTCYKGSHCETGYVVKPIFPKLLSNKKIWEAFPSSTTIETPHEGYGYSGYIIFRQSSQRLQWLLVSNSRVNKGVNGGVDKVVRVVQTWE